MRPDLLIGIGNPLRGDDGVGALLLEELALELEERDRTIKTEQDRELDGELKRERSAGRSPAAQLTAVHQLTPELALAVAEARRVLFVDAWAHPDSAEPWIEPLLPRQREGDGPGRGCLGTHGLDPLALLVLAEVLYGWRGEAALLRVPAFAFPHGPGFSPALEQALPKARDLVRRWLGEG